MNFIQSILDTRNTKGNTTLNDFFAEVGIKNIPKNILQTSDAQINKAETQNIVTELKKFFKNANIQSFEENETMSVLAKLSCCAPTTIRVTKNTERPIKIPHPENGNELLIIFVEENVIADMVRLGDTKNIKHQHTVICVGNNAEVTYSSLHGGKNSIQISTETFFLKNNCKLRANITSLEQRAGFHSTQVIAMGNNSSNHLNITCEVNKESHQVVKANNTFVGKNSFGRIRMNAILEDDAKSYIEGKIRIRNKANNTDSNLSEKIILLGDTSICNAKPIIAIDTDDVKAGHGASISRIDQEDLFYFRSRGINTTQAHQLIKRGFLGGLFENLGESHPFMQVLQKKLS